ncbi:fatty acid-binding protein 2-like [Trichoplusia ni]|uniref:Fatty acid-binding protein 2-like n=1 Tax=Trichoplusia ni TaxID=7111 RepID=A0A7E5VI81_TRINI|nr:fatty acid-binding protein 2-like [Trichoplusia ni]
MSFLGKTYTFVSHENFDGFLKAVGVPEDKIPIFLKSKPSQRLEKNGDSYTYYTNSESGPKETTFKSGVEFDDTIGVDNTPIKSKYVVEGNKVTQTIVTDKGTASFVREYNGDDLNVTITSSLWDGVAKRVYKA